MNLVGLRWLLEHGANPDCPKPGRTSTTLDYLIGTYVPSKELAACIELLRNAGGTTRTTFRASLIRLWTDAISLLSSSTQIRVYCPDNSPNSIAAAPARDAYYYLARLYFTSRLSFRVLDCARLLIERGGHVNASAMAGHAGTSGQTPIFHAVSQFKDRGLEMTELLLQCGADLRLRVKLPGHYERQEEFVECTPLGYALRLPGSEFPGSNEATLSLLRQKGGVK